MLTDWRRPGMGVTGEMGDRAASELLAVVDKVGTEEGWKREGYLKGGVEWRSLFKNCFVSILAIHSTVRDSEIKGIISSGVYKKKSECRCQGDLFLVHLSKLIVVSNKHFNDLDLVVGSAVG